MASTNLLINYVDYDFDNLVIQLQNRLKERKAWQDVYKSSTGQMLIEFYAYIANLCLFYIERRAEEGYLDTAKLRSSVVNLVKLINYLPKRKTSSLGLLTFSISSPHTKDIIIPIGTKVKSSDELEFIVGEKELDSITGEYTGRLTGGGVLRAGTTSVDLYAMQGKLVQREVSATGAINQEYLIQETDVENDALSVSVDGTPWYRVSSFSGIYRIPGNDDEYTICGTDPVYIVRQELDDTLRIVFGDNVKGLAPPQGSVILLQYVVTDGIEGNVYAGDKLTNLESTLVDVDGAVQSVTVTNSSALDDDGEILGAFVGGDDAEDIEEIKAEAPQIFQTGDRAVTRYDYIAIIKNRNGVADVNVWGENEENPPNYDMFNKVNIVLLMQEWAHPTTAFKQALTEYIREKSMITVKYEYIQATILEVIAVVDLLVAKNYSLTDAREDVLSEVPDDSGGPKGVLPQQFVLGETALLGQDVKYSNLVQAIDELEGISHHHLTLEIYKELVFGNDSIYDYGETLDATAIREGSVRVFVNDGTVEYQVARDDEAGGFTYLDEDGNPYEDVDGNPLGYTVTGSINYTTGVIGVTLSPDPASDYVVYVRYQQDPKEADMAEPIENYGIVVTHRQICRLKEVDITSIAHET